MNGRRVSDNTIAAVIGHYTCWRSNILFLLFAWVFICSFLSITYQFMILQLTPLVTHAMGSIPPKLVSFLFYGTSPLIPHTWMSHQCLTATVVSTLLVPILIVTDWQKVGWTSNTPERMRALLTSLFHSQPPNWKFSVPTREKSVWLRRSCRESVNNFSSFQNFPSLLLKSCLVIHFF